MNIRWYWAAALSVAFHLAILSPWQATVTRRNEAGSGASTGTGNGVLRTARVTALAPHDAPAERPPASPAGTAPAAPSPQREQPSSAARSSQDEYLPRSALTQPPQPRGEILVPYPEAAPAGRWRAVLTLFIDVEGRVRRVRVETPGLPAPFAEAARQAFMAAPYAPGRVHDQAVNARIAVEIEFEAQEPPRNLHAP